MACMMNIRLPGMVSLVLCAIFLTGAAAGETAAQPSQTAARPQLGVFSWQRENISNEGSLREMLDTLVQVGAGEVYQYMDTKAAPSFLRMAKELRIDVYALAGRPEWGLDPNAKRMLNEIKKVAKLTAQLGDAGPAGLMLDIEPYLTDAYKKNPDRTMETYLAAMRKTYAYAQEAGVTLILCIPYFYDSLGHTDVLNALIRETSDAVAVMNYHKKNESGQIKTEMAAATQAGKRLIHIYELQALGLFDLTERNTYHLDGLPAVWASRDKLQAAFKSDSLSFALHDYTALREVLTRK